MGFLQATEMASMTDLETGLAWHLQSNHFPPVSRLFVPTCIEAINACNTGDYEHEIEMPNGKIRTAAFIVEGLHLNVWLENEEG